MKGERERSPVLFGLAPRGALVIWSCSFARRHAGACSCFVSQMGSILVRDSQINPYLFRYNAHTKRKTQKPPLRGASKQRRGETRDHLCSHEKRRRDLFGCGRLLLWKRKACLRTKGGHERERGVLVPGPVLYRRQRDAAATISLHNLLQYVGRSASTRLLSRSTSVLDR